jgi:hypothetical protein
VDTIILIEKLLTNFDLHIIEPLYYADNSSYQLLYGVFMIKCHKLSIYGSITALFTIGLISILFGKY